MKKLLIITVAVFIACAFLGCTSNNVSQYTENGATVSNIEGIITDISEDGNNLLIDNAMWVQITNKTKLGMNDKIPLHEQFIEPTFRVGNELSAFTENPSASKPKVHTVYINWNWNAPIIEVCEPLLRDEPELELIF